MDTIKLLTRIWPSPTRVTQAEVWTNEMKYDTSLRRGRTDDYSLRDRSGDLAATIKIGWVL